MHEALEPTQDPGWVLSHEGEAVAELRGQVTAVLALLGNSRSENKSFEASETIRKLSVARE
jgi:hypothetical protein